MRSGPILAVIVLINGVAGAIFSPVTRVRQVRIEGAMPHDRDRVVAAIQPARNVPWIQLNPARIRERLLDAPEVADAGFSANPLGEARAWVRYRVPVARLEGQPGVVMDDRGGWFRLPNSDVPTGLIDVRVPQGRPPTLATIAADLPARKIAELAMAARDLPDGGGVRIDVDAAGGLCLNMRTGRVILGSSEDLDRKLEVLRKRLARDPSELRRVRTLNLTLPERPTVPRKAVPTPPGN